MPEPLEYLMSWEPFELTRVTGKGLMLSCIIVFRRKKVYMHDYVELDNRIIFRVSFTHNAADLSINYHYSYEQVVIIHL